MSEGIFRYFASHHLKPCLRYSYLLPVWKSWSSSTAICSLLRRIIGHADQFIPFFSGSCRLGKPEIRWMVFERKSSNSAQNILLPKEISAYMQYTLCVWIRSNVVMACFCLSCCILEKISMGNHLKHLDVITTVSKGQCFGREDLTIIHQELNSRFFSVPAGIKSTSYACSGSPAFGLQTLILMPIP